MSAKRHLAGRSCAAAQRSRRGERTRARLVQVAGKLFAQRGFAAVTGAEICRRAGAHPGAIVYHFGGTTGLYTAVLEEARERLVSTEALSRAVHAQSEPNRKLEAFLGLMVRALTGPMSRSWAGQLFGREFVSPSHVYGRAHDRVLSARAGLLRSILSELTGLPPDHALVVRSCICVMAPCAVLLLFDRPKLQRLLPGVNLGTAGAAALTRQLVDFGLGGLSALTSPATRSRLGAASPASQRFSRRSRGFQPSGALRHDELV